MSEPFTMSDHAIHQWFDYFLLKRHLGDHKRDVVENLRALCLLGNAKASEFDHHTRTAVANKLRELADEMERADD